jgi:hypothetical protein
MFIEWSMVHYNGRWKWRQLRLCGFKGVRTERSDECGRQAWFKASRLQTFCKQTPCDGVGCEG